MKCSRSSCVRSLVLFFTLVFLIAVSVSAHAQSSDDACRELFQSTELTERPHMVQPIPADSEEFQRLLELVKEANPQLGPNFNLVFPGDTLRIPEGSYISARLQRYLREQLEGVEVPSCIQTRSETTTDTTMVFVKHEKKAGGFYWPSLWWPWLFLLGIILIPVAILLHGFINSDQGESGSNGSGNRGNSNSSANESSHRTRASSGHGSSSDRGDHETGSGGNHNDSNSSAENNGNNKNGSKSNTATSDSKDSDSSGTGGNDKPAEEPHRSAEGGKSVTYNFDNCEFHGCDFNGAAGEKSKAVSKDKHEANHREIWGRGLAKKERESKS